MWQLGHKREGATTPQQQMPWRRGGGASTTTANWLWLYVVNSPAAADGEYNEHDAAAYDDDDDDDESNKQDDDNYRIDDDDCIAPSSINFIGEGSCVVVGQETTMTELLYNMHNCGYTYTVRYSIDWADTMDGIPETGKFTDLLPDVDNDLKFNHTYKAVGEYVWSMNLTDVTGTMLLTNATATVVQSQSECYNRYNAKMIAQRDNHHHVHAHNRHPVVATANARLSWSPLESDRNMNDLYVVTAALLFGSVIIVIIRRYFYESQKYRMAALP